LYEKLDIVGIVAGEDFSWGNSAMRHRQAQRHHGMDWIDAKWQRSTRHGWWSGTQLGNERITAHKLLDSSPAVIDNCVSLALLLHALLDLRHAIREGAWCGNLPKAV